VSLRVAQSADDERNRQNAHHERESQLDPRHPLRPVGDGSEHGRQRRSQMGLHIARFAHPGWGVKVRAPAFDSRFLERRCRAGVLLRAPALRSEQQRSFE
jgi:hypothetical protein